MEELLNKVGAGHLVERFKIENVDISALCNATDQDLARLNVSTIGNRIRLRKVCKIQQQQQQIVTTTTTNQTHFSASNQNSNMPGSSSASSLNSYSQIIRERSSLFKSGKRKISQILRRGGKKHNTITRSWTVQFFFLTSKYASKVPTIDEKVVLYNAGLRLKKIKLSLTDIEQDVYSKITSSDVGEDNRPTGFPQLIDCGGFELMTCFASS